MLLKEGLQLNMYTIEEIKYKGYTIKIHPDNDAENPREWGNIGKIVALREHLTHECNDNLKDVSIAYACIKRYNAVFLPIFIGQAGIYTDIGKMVVQKLQVLNTDFDDHDMFFEVANNQIGIIFVDSDEIAEVYGSDNVENRAKALECLVSQIDIYNKWRNGEVVGFTVENAEGDIVDSCWGFYSVEEAIEAAKENLPSVQEVDAA
jgi:hypothetical protein